MYSVSQSHHNRKPFSIATFQFACCKFHYRNGRNIVSPSTPTIRIIGYPTYHVANKCRASLSNRVQFFSRVRLNEIAIVEAVYVRYSSIEITRPQSGFAIVEESGGSFLVKSSFCQSVPKRVIDRTAQLVRFPTVEPRRASLASKSDV